MVTGIAVLAPGFETALQRANALDALLSRRSATRALVASFGQVQ